MKPVKRLWRALLAATAVASMYAITAWLAWDSSRGFGSVVDWGWSFIGTESCGNCTILVFDREAWNMTWAMIVFCETGLMLTIGTLCIGHGSKVKTFESRPGRS